MGKGWMDGYIHERTHPSVPAVMIDGQLADCCAGRGVDKDARALSIESQEIERLAKDRDAERKILEDGFYGRLGDLLKGQVVASAPKDLKLKKGTKLDKAGLEDIARSVRGESHSQNEIGRLRLRGKIR